jgi:chorismate lyase / 3-hydroxybenzoate synthase
LPNHSKVDAAAWQLSFGRSGSDVDAQAAPMMHVPMPVIASSSMQALECWQLPGALSFEQDAGLSLVMNGQVLMGVIELSEAAHVPGDTSVTALEGISQLAYLALFQAMDRLAYPHLWRTWNYMASINQHTHGLERYRQFNQGRQQGFAQHARATTGSQVPAACALGFTDPRDDRLFVGFVAGKHPAITIENPRQVSAYHYPEQYGAKSPTFSRACLVPLPAQELFLLSGTASIVGHQTVHAGDIAEQTRETLRNLDVLIEQANLKTSGKPYTRDDLQLRVYLRDAQHAGVVQDILGAWSGSVERHAFVQADVCRQDLDIEIEGHAVNSMDALAR